MLEGLRVFGFKVMSLAKYDELCEEIDHLKLEKEQRESEDKSGICRGGYCEKCKHGIRSIVPGSGYFLPQTEYFCALRLPCKEFVGIDVGENE